MFHIKKIMLSLILYGCYKYVVLFDRTITAISNSIVVPIFASMGEFSWVKKKLKKQRLTNDELIDGMLRFIDDTKVEQQEENVSTHLMFLCSLLTINMLLSLWYLCGKSLSFIPLDFEIRRYIYAILFFISSWLIHYFWYSKNRRGWKTIKKQEMNRGNKYRPYIALVIYIITWIVLLVAFLELVFGLWGILDGIFE